MPQEIPESPLSSRHILEWNMVSEGDMGDKNLNPVPGLEVEPEYPLGLRISSRGSWGEHDQGGGAKWGEHDSRLPSDRTDASPVGA